MKNKQSTHRIPYTLHSKKGLAILFLSGFICGCDTSGHAYRANLDKGTVDVDNNTVDTDRNTVHKDNNTVHIDNSTVDIDNNTVN